MSPFEAIEATVLDEGLEADIPLPEIAETCVREGLLAVETESDYQALAEVLTQLLVAGRIKVLSGHWSDPEPRFVDDIDEATQLLADLRQYTYSSEEAFDLKRVFYVNVQNLVA